MRKEEAGDNSVSYTVCTKYIIAMCVQKMEQRFTHSLSTFYLESLKAVREITFEDIQMDGTHRQNDDDYDFMTQLASMCQNPSWTLPKMIPRLASKALQLPPKVPRGVISIYTSDTCMEFHKLLCTLLESFRVLIKDLTACVRGAEGSDIHDLLDSTFFMGYTLWRMTGGRAFQIYMQNVENYLRDPRSPSPPPSTSSPDLVQDKKEGAGSDPEEERDQELEATMTSWGNNNKPVTLQMAYWNWLRLMLVYYDEVPRLRNFVRSPHFSPDADALSIKLLLTPEVDRNSLKWDDLLNSKYFPGNPEQRPPQRNNQLRQEGSNCWTSASPVLRSY